MQRVLLMLKSSPEQETALEELLRQQQDPGSPNYHRWLTPEQFGEQFGATAEEVDIVSGWLRDHGFTVANVAKSRREIEFSGAVRQIQNAFRTEIHQYELAGENHIANATDISVPAALTPVVAGVAALNDFPLRKAAHVEPRVNYTDGSHGVSPYDFATIYNVLPLWNSQGIDGSGQSIAIVAQSNINVSDITTFRSRFGLPPNDPQIVLNGPDPGIRSGDQDEAELDVEWSGAVAKAATIKLVVSAGTNSSSGVSLSSSYIVNNNVAPVISVSYGICEAFSPNTATYYGGLWQQAAAQGISVFVASGDAGSADCDSTSQTTASRGFSVDSLSSSPYNVAVGGTQFNENGADSTYWNSSNSSTTLSSAKSYIPEIVWNDSGGVLASSGGGVSMYWPTPSWQTGLGVPAEDPGAPGLHHRYVPDVSLAASSKHDGYELRLRGAAYSAGGTSAAAPAFAGIMAMINQATGHANGNPNPRLYAIAAQTPSVFHDVVSGSNAVACRLGTPNCSDSGVMNGYNAGSGYDLTTGLGSVDVSALVFAWSGVAPQVVINSTSLSAGAITATYAQALNATGGTSPYTWNVAGGSLPPGVNLDPAGFLTGSPTAGGVYSVTLRVTDSKGASASVSFQITVADVASGTAATTHVFPQFADGQLGGGISYRTTLMISNPWDAVAANCSLQLWSGGRVVTVQGLSSGYSMPPAGWVIATTTGAQSFQSGYATLQCSAKVEAQMLYSLYSGGVKVSEATVFSSPPSSSVRILADERQGAHLALAIANDSDQSVSYAINVSSGAGATASGSVTVGPRSSTAKFLDELMAPDILTNTIGSVVISSTTGTASVIGLRFSGNIFTTILGNPASAAGPQANTFHVFPQYADGRFGDGTSYRTTRLYVNPNPSGTASCTVQLRGMTTNGVSSFGADLPPANFVITSTAGTQSFQQGYATIQCSAKVDAQAFYSYYAASGAKLGEATVFSSPPSARLQILADGRDGSQLGLAIANDSDQANSYTITAYDAIGNSVGSAARTINPRTSIAAFVNEFIPNLPAGYYGAVVVTSRTGPANVIGLRFTGSAFTTIPATVK